MGQSWAGVAAWATMQSAGGVKGALGCGCGCGLAPGWLVPGLVGVRLVIAGPVIARPV